MTSFAGPRFSSRGTRPPRALIVAFIDECRQADHAVESICRVLTEQGCQIAARTYRAWSCEQQQVAARTFTDALVMDKVRDLVWTVDADGALAGVRRLTHEGLYGRRKMTKLVQRTMPEASPGAVDRAMKALGLKGIRRSKGVRTTIPGKDGTGAGDLLNRDFTAAAPNVGDGLHLLPELGRLRLRRVHRRRVRPEDRVPGTAPPPKTSSSS